MAVVYCLSKTWPN